MNETLKREAFCIEYFIGHFYDNNKSSGMFIVTNFIYDFFYFILHSLDASPQDLFIMRLNLLRHQKQALADHQLGLEYLDRIGISKIRMGNNMAAVE